LLRCNRLSLFKFNVRKAAFMQGLRVGCLFRILFLLKPNIASDIINSEEFLRFLFYSARYFLKTKYTKQG